MLFGKNLQRSYKYIMYATKTPSLRIDQSDLKCKSGCGFYGNAQWHGYCSKCHREQLQRQRRAEQSLTSNNDVDSNASHEKGQKVHPLAFSKFEEKKLRQTDSLKKSKLLKLNVFRKTSIKDSDEERVNPPRHPSTQLTISQNSLEAQKKDFFQTFPNLNQNIEKDIRRITNTLFTRIVKQFHLKTVDEMSENVQNGYQAFLNRMQSNPHYAEVDSETKEQVLDFVEKHVQTYLHSMLFSPTGTDDEKADARLHTRIRQLSWVTPQHLDCQIDQRNTKVRDLLYEAITELVSMDSVLYPGGKLACIVNCCRSVVSLIGARGGGPASADELLPALIFTVLKANPPRLTSNINFITRFCNAARLMTGEGGYYFTNLCCAVSFIENLTAESLSMSDQEFNCYMKMPSTIGGGSWVAALSLCEGMHEYREQMKAIDNLNKRIDSIEKQASDIAEEAESFSDELSKKVEDILVRTPLDFSKCKMVKYNSSSKEFTTISYGIMDLDNLVAISNSQSFDLLDNTAEHDSNEDLVNPIIDLNDTQPSDVTPSSILIKNINSSAILEPFKLEKKSVQELSMANNPSGTHRNYPRSLPLNHVPTVSTSNHARPFQTPSLIADRSTFQTNSVNDLFTPDEFCMEHFIQGLVNVNYDFLDVFDLSGENSVADDLPIANDNRQEFDVNHRCLNLPTVGISPGETFFDSELDADIDDGTVSILDTNDSPTAECLLPSPIKPLNPSDLAEKN